MRAATENDPVLILDEETDLVAADVLRIPARAERTGRWRDEKAFEVHTALREVGAARHCVDVYLAKLLRLMRDGEGYRRWGVTGFPAYLTEGLRQKSVRRFQYLVSIDKAIASRPLPKFGEAWRRGEVTVSQARELIRVMTPESEGRWIDLAGQVGVRKLARMIDEAIKAGESPQREAGHPSGAAPHDDSDDHDEEIPWRREVVSATRPVDAAWQAAVETSRRMAGYDMPVHECVEDWTAEYASGCTVMPGLGAADAGGREPFDPRSRFDIRWITHEVEPAAEELRFLRKVGREVRLAADPLETPGGAAALDAAELEKRIRWLLRLEGRVSWYECRLLRLVAGLRLYQRLGFTSLAQYAVEAVGSSERRAWWLVRLAKDLDNLPKVGEALREGRITALEAELVCKVARGSTQDAWVARARTVTLAALKEDVEFVLAADDDAGLPPERPLPGGRPPCAAPVVRGPRARGDSDRTGWADEVPACAAETSGVVVVPLAHRVEGWYSAFGTDPAAVARQMLSDAGRKRPIGFAAPPETSLQWALTLSHCRFTFREDEVPSDSQIVAVVLLNFLGQWASPEILKESRSHRVFTRDGWRCQVPGCRSRAHLHAHHVVFRSRGGPDADWNVVTICLAHHRMIHAGVIAVRGRAPCGLEWGMGVNAAGDVRERFRNGTRVECDPYFRAGATAPATRSRTDWRVSLPCAAARGA